jgi:hypothetical protein
MSASVLRRRYRRLLAVYPSDWRAANEPVVPDTLLEAAGPTRRWPSPREALALLAGGARAWLRRPRPDPGERGRRWLDGLQLGAILLALWTLAATLGQLGSWAGHGVGDGPGSVPAADGSAAASGSVLAVLAAVAFVSLLRGRVRTALVAVMAWVLAGVLWAIIGYPAGTAVDGLAIGPAMVVWLAVVVVVSLVGLVAALALAAATGEVRPAVALAVVGLPWILGTVLGRLSSPAAALVVTALAAWGARRARQRQGQGRAAGGPAAGAPPHNDA